MGEYNQIIALIAMSMGAAWASGINLYATVLMLGIMGATGNISLPAELQMLSDPMVIGAAGLMYFIEFFKSITDAKTGGSLKPYKNTFFISIYNMLDNCLKNR